MSKFVSLCDPRGRSQAHAWQNCYLAEVEEEDNSNATCFVKSRLIWNRPFGGHTLSLSLFSPFWINVSVLVTLDCVKQFE